MRLMWPWCIPVNGHLNTSHLVRVFLKTACLRCHGKIRTECWGLRTEQKVLPDARRLHMSVDEDDFTIINVKIYLTWQPPIIVSAFLPELWFASTYLQFGVICDILWYHRFSKAWFFADYLNISLSPDIWFFVRDICKIHFVSSPQHIVYSLIWHKVIFTIFQFHHPSLLQHHSNCINLNGRHKNAMPEVSVW